MDSRSLIVANVQMVSIDDVAANLQQAESLIEKIFSQSKPRLVCLPENCLYLRLVEGETITGFEVSDPALLKFSEWALRYDCYFHLGSVPLRVEGHLYNSSVLVHPSGKIQPTYQKMHLFDIQLEGQKPLRESDAFRHGQHPSIIQVDGWKIGETICYDVRFAELFSHYARKQVDAILVPAAFLVKTGEAHWEVLLRARAIESQAYVIAAAQGGQHKGQGESVRMTYGHSMTVDPWGVVTEIKDSAGPGYVISTLQKNTLDRVRQQIPMALHRRLPVA